MLRLFSFNLHFDKLVNILIGLLNFSFLKLPILYYDNFYLSSQELFIFLLFISFETIIHYRFYILFSILFFIVYKTEKLTNDNFSL